LRSLICVCNKTCLQVIKKNRRPLHKLSDKERILGSMGDCPAFIVQATNHITMIAMKQCQANVGLARNTFEIRASDIETRMTATGAPKPDLRYSIYIPGTKIEKRTAYIFYHPGDFYCVTSTD